jgi:hypothetical protein
VLTRLGGDYIHVLEPRVPHSKRQQRYLAVFATWENAGPDPSDSEYGSDCNIARTGLVCWTVVSLVNQLRRFKRLSVSKYG